MGKDLRLYRTSEGKAPVEDWLEDLRDVAGRAKIKISSKPIGIGGITKGVYETV